jgi:hypothetical protein
MASDTHSHDANSNHDHDHAHGDADHGHDDGHHHEGPVSHTEVVPEKSLEDNLLMLLLTVAFVFLSGTTLDWFMNVKYEGHGGGEGTHTTAPAGHEGAPGAGHEGAAAPEAGHEAAPAAPAGTTPGGTPVTPDLTGTPGKGDGAPGSVPAETPGVHTNPAETTPPGATAAPAGETPAAPANH